MIRLVKPADIAALLKIYAEYINTPITFECALPTEEDFSRRIAGISGFYPYLVCEEAGKVAGYAYAHRHMEREAYQWNAELSVYLDPSFKSKGLGKKLYGVLIEILRLQGIRTVYGCVTVPNEKSVALHEAMDFTPVGTYRNAGFKAGKWHDVTWFEKTIAPHNLAPGRIVSIDSIPEDRLQKIMSSFE